MEARHLWVNPDDPYDVITTEELLIIPIGERHGYISIDSIITRSKLAGRMNSLLREFIEYEQKTAYPEALYRINDLFVEYNALIERARQVSGDYSAHKDRESDDHLAKIVESLVQIATDMRHIRYKMELMKR
jgi:hypothetical protein